MAVDLALMCASPREASVKGKTYTFSPLTLGDIAELQEWFVLQPVEDLSKDIANFGEHMTPEHKGKLVAEAHEEYEKRRKVVRQATRNKELINEVADKMQAALGTVDAVAMMMWLSIRTHHPEVTREECKKLMDVNTLVAVKALMDEISFESQDKDADLQYADYSPEKKTEG